MAQPYDDACTSTYRPRRGCGETVQREVASHCGLTGGTRRDDSSRRRPLKVKENRQWKEPYPCVQARTSLLSRAHRAETVGRGTVQSGFNVAAAAARIVPCRVVLRFNPSTSRPFGAQHLHRYAPTYKLRLARTHGCTHHIHRLVPSLR